MSTHSRRRLVAAALVAAVAVVAGCSADAPGESETTGTPGASTVPGITAGDGGPVGSVEPPTVERPIESMVVTAREDVATGLAAPWDMEVAPDGSLLVTERDTARVMRVRDGSATPLTGPGADALVAAVDATQEAGLLGIALLPDDPTVLYVYLTRGDGNAVVRMSLDGDTLGAPVDVLAGIPKARNHDGGRIAFGPDGHLYIATGDAARPESAQDNGSLAGSVLRVVATGGDGDGAPADGNPFGNEIWTWGHRNVQGLGWTPDGTMFASEFGQSDADELNIIVAGANYGWPAVEGLLGSPDGTSLGATVDGFTYPVAQWQPTSAASPSGIAVTAEAVYVAALRGEALYRVPFTADGVGEPQVLLDDLGRVRDVTLAPDGALLVLTNNTDGRGSPREGDDRIVRIEIAPQ